MCGRYILVSKEKIKNTLNVSVEENYNIAPSMRVLLLNESLQPFFSKWGIDAHMKKKKRLVFNARSETLNSKILFRNCKRCIFIANGYFEWKQESNKKYPYFFYFERKFMFFAGIYNNNGCSIITKDSHKSIAHIHSRQPFIIEENRIEDWIRKKTIYPSEINQTIMFHKVGFDVNSLKNNTLNNIKKV